MLLLTNSFSTFTSLLCACPVIIAARDGGGGRKAEVKLSQLDSNPHVVKNCIIHFIFWKGREFFPPNPHTSDLSFQGIRQKKKQKQTSRQNAVLAVNLDNEATATPNGGHVKRLELSRP